MVGKPTDHISHNIVNDVGFLPSHGSIWIPYAYRLGVSRFGKSKKVRIPQLVGHGNIADGYCRAIVCGEWNRAVNAVFLIRTKVVDNPLRNAHVAGLLYRKMRVKKIYRLGVREPREDEKKRPEHKHDGL